MMASEKILESNLGGFRAPRRSIAKNAADFLITSQRQEAAGAYAAIQALVG